LDQLLLAKLVTRSGSLRTGYGDARGDELPAEIATAKGRRVWLREAKRQLDERRAEQAAPIARSRPARLKEAKRRLDEELQVECRANEAYVHPARPDRAGGVLSRS
jgi:hypothetical protein